MLQIRLLKLCLLEHWPGWYELSTLCRDCLEVITRFKGACFSWLPENIGLRV